MAILKKENIIFGDIIPWRNERMSKHCWEIVVYRIEEEKFDEFLTIRNQIYDSLRTQPGFISAETYSSVRQKETLVDMLRWETPEDATRAFDQFRSIPSAKEFMATIRQILFSDHVQMLEGSEKR